MRSRKTDVVKLVWTWILALLAAIIFHNEAYASRFNPKERIDPRPTPTSEISADAIFSNPGTYTDIKLLTNNTDAFKAKLQMVDQAKDKIDIVYFIWEDDYTSSLFMQHLMLRADDGLKIRILVDYMQTEKQVPALLTLANHVSIEKDADGKALFNHNIQVKRFRGPSDKLIVLLRENGIDPYAFIHAFMILDKPSQDNIKDIVEKSPVGKEVKDFSEQVQLAEGKPPPVPLIIAFVLKLLKHKVPALYRELNAFLRRSHYKLLLIDDKRFMVGGRNISDQYHTEGHSRFLLETKENAARYAFQDTDLEATEGPRTSNQQTQSEAFYRLWNFVDTVYASDPRYYYDEGGQIMPPQLPETEISRRAEEAHRLGYDDGKFTKSTLDMKGPVQGQLFENAPSTVVMAPPTWLQGESLYDRLVFVRQIAHEYVNLIEAAKNRIDIVTAYFYIDDIFQDREFNKIYSALVDAVKRGVKVTVYTNSPLSTDLAIVNDVAYTKYKDLNNIGKNIGIKIYELAPGEGVNDQGSLHTKVMTIDDTVMAVGSFNLDPRSEMYDTNDIIVLKDNTQTLVRHFREERGVPNDLNKFDEEIRDSKTLRWVLPADSEMKKDMITLPKNLAPVFNILKSSI